MIPGALLYVKCCSTPVSIEITHLVEEGKNSTVLVILAMNFSFGAFHVLSCTTKLLVDKKKYLKVNGALLKGLDN